MMLITNNQINPNQNRKNRMVMVMMLACIFLSDALLFVYNSRTILTTLAQYITVFLAIVFMVLCLYRRKCVINASFAGVLLISLYISFESVIHNEIRGGYISKIAVFILGFCLIDYFYSNNLLKAYKKWMDIICVWSLVGLLFGRVIVRFSFLPQITTILGRRFAFLFLTNVPTDDLIRNYGPFTEPSRFQAFICLALVFELFVHSSTDKLKWKRVALYLITIITTFSATAFAALGIIAIAYFSSKEVNLSIGKRVLLISIIIGIVAILVNYSSGVNIAMSKFQLGEKSESFTVRLNSIVGGIRVTLSNPLFGTGFGRFEQLYLEAISDLPSSRSHTSTNTFVLYFAKFGIPVGLYYVFNVFQMLKSFCKPYTAVILLIAVFLFTSGISLVDSIVFSSFIFFRNNNQDSHNMNL